MLLRRGRVGVVGRVAVARGGRGGRHAAALAHARVLHLRGGDAHRGRRVRGCGGRGRLLLLLCLPHVVVAAPAAAPARRVEGGVRVRGPTAPRPRLSRHVEGAARGRLREL